MAQEQIGVPQRNLEPLECVASESGVGVTEVPAAEIWMTPELKQAAQKLLCEWGQSHNERMAELQIRNVQLKFPGTAERAAFLNELVKFAKLVNPQFPSMFPLPHPTPATQPLDNAGERAAVWATFWSGYFFPPTFDEVAQDVAGTELDAIPANPELLTQASAYLAACAPGFIRLELDADESMDQGQVGQLTESLRQAQSLLRSFLQLLCQSLPNPEVHRIIVLGEDQFVVDGKPTTFSGQALRALLTLLLLRKNSAIGLADFAALLHGKESSDARTDFDNALKALKKVLPKISTSASVPNFRTVQGLKFLVRVEDAALKTRLATFYKK